MSESRVTAIKLFGRTITPFFGANHVPSSSSVSACADVGNHDKETSSSSSSSCSSLRGLDRVKEQTDDENKKEDNKNRGSKDPQISSDLNEEPKTTSEISSPKSSKNNGDQQSEITTASTSQEKTTMKKPDKILPCPRCNSSETKFCYYNNYNVNQPRHFCKNCQRYWTAGGSMRNVPVGAGRRKNKSSASSSHGLQINHVNNSSATILSFGSSDSLVSEVVHDGFYASLQKKLDAAGNDQPTDTTITADSASRKIKNCQGFVPPQASFPVPPPWPYQGNPAIPNPNFYPLTFYWGCAVPFFSPSNTSPSLGKRMRDENLPQTERERKDTEKNGLVSESPRIDEQGEAAKCSVWSAVRTKPEKADKSSFFSGFETKGNNRSFMSETSIALQANPAALARSLNFRESM